MKTWKLNGYTFAHFFPSEFQVFESLQSQTFANLRRLKLFWLPCQRAPSKPRSAAAHPPTLIC